MIAAWNARYAELPVPNFDAAIRERFQTETKGGQAWVYAAPVAIA